MSRTTPSSKVGLVQVEMEHGQRRRTPQERSSPIEPPSETLTTPLVVSNSFNPLPGSNADESDGVRRLDGEYTLEFVTHLIRRIVEVK